MGFRGGEQLAVRLRFTGENPSLDLVMLSLARCLGRPSLPRSSLRNANKLIDLLKLMTVRSTTDSGLVSRNFLN